MPLPDHGLSTGFMPVGPTIEAPPCETHEYRDTESWIARWEATLHDLVGEHDPWGFVGMRPDGDVELFEASQAGVRRCAEWAVTVRLLQPVRAEPLTELYGTLETWARSEAVSCAEVDRALRAFLDATSIADRRALGGS